MKTDSKRQGAPVENSITRCLQGEGEL